MLGFNCSFYIHLDKKNLCYFVKGSNRVTLFSISNDVVTLVKKISEFILFENLESIHQLFDFIIRCVGVRNPIDLFKVLRHPFVKNAPVASLTVIVGNKEGCIAQACIVLTLSINRPIYEHVVCFAFHYNEW